MSDYTITLQEGKDYTKAWREAHGNMRRAFTIEKAEIDEIFENSDAKSMRTYMAIKDGKETLVLVGVDANGKDILDPVFDHVGHCPSDCDETSPLNSNS